MRAFTLLNYFFASLMVAAGPAAAEIVADNVKCVECINQIDIHRGAVATRHLMSGAVGGDAIQDGVVDWGKLALSLQQRILDLEDRLAQLEGNSVLNPDGYLSFELTDSQKPIARFAGVNVQVINGAGSSNTVNGLGNLLVGYDEAAVSIFPICSLGQFQDETACVSAGGLWAIDHKSGSHNVVIGPMHRYSAAGGLLAGSANASTRHNASILGGVANVVSGYGATVSGGENNYASADWAAVSGGTYNTASEYYSVVSGGTSNISGGVHSVVSGGQSNIASGDQSVVSGGHQNSAASGQSVVSGGIDNLASGSYSVVSGGHQNTAGNNHSVVSGGSQNTASGLYSVVSGGGENTAAGAWSVVSGGYLRRANGTYDWVAGSLFETD